MEKKEYCDRVLAQIGRLTGEEESELRSELSGHIEDHAEALAAHGCGEEEALARAVELMGDPEEAGRALRDCYRHFWLVIVRRIAIAVTVISLVQTFFLLSMFSGVFESLKERVLPTVNELSWDELSGAADLRERIPIGNDVVQLNRIEFGVREGKRQAVLWVSAYDCIPGGRVYERLVATLTLQNERGETMYGSDGIPYASCTSSGGTIHVNTGRHVVPLGDGDTYVTLVYDRFGERIETRIDLPEGGEQP